MPALKPYHLFISHAWKYGEDYYRLVNLLNNAPNFSYWNYSAPENKPLQNLDSTDVRTKVQIKDSIQRKILPANCVLVISGMYYNHREWMQYEINTAQNLGKPIIAIKPYGNTFIPSAILNVASISVNWNTNSIVEAIRLYSR